MSEEEKAKLEELYENSEWWHNRFKAVQRDYEELTKRNKELEDGFKSVTDELCEYATKLDKAIKYINDLYDVRFTDKDKRKLLELLGDKE